MYLSDAGYNNPIRGYEYIYWYLRSFIVHYNNMCYNDDNMLQSFTLFLNKNFVTEFVIKTKEWLEIGTFGVCSI